MTTSGRTSDPRRYDAPGRDHVLSVIRDMERRGAERREQDIAEEAGVSRRTVRYHLAELVRLGWIARDPVRVLDRRVS